MARERSADRALVEACLRGEGGAWEELIAAASPGLAAVVRETLRRARCPADAAHVDDRLAETFAELLRDDCRTLRSWSGQASLLSWLKVIAYRRTLKFIDRRRPAPSLDDSAAGLTPTATGASPGEEVELRESRALVRGALEKLKTRDRVLLEGHVIRGQSYAALAERLGVKESSVGPLLARAKKRLRALLSARGIG